MGVNEDKGGKLALLPPFILCSLSVLLFMAGVYLPIIGVAVALAAPAPIALAGLRYNLRTTFIGIIFALLIVYILFGELVTVSFMIGTALLGLSLALTAPRVKTAGEAMLLFVASSVALKVAFMFAMIAITGHNPFLFDEASLREMFSSFPSAGTDEMFSLMIKQLPLIIPSFLTLAAGLDCLVNYLLVSKIELKVRGEKTPVPNMPSLGEWRFPRSILSALLVALLLPFFSGDEPSRVLISVELNLKIIVNVMFFIQGLSFVWWWTARKNFQRGIRLLIFIVLMIPIFSMGVVALGIGDIWLNLRDRLDKAKGEKK